MKPRASRSLVALERGLVALQRFEARIRTAQAAVTAGAPLVIGEQLIASGAVEGPFRRTRPVSREPLLSAIWREVTTYIAKRKPTL